MLDIVINSKPEIEDNFDIHEHIIDTFKSEIFDVFLQNYSLINRIVIEFEYNPELRKFKIKSIPEFYKDKFERILDLNNNLKKYYFL